MMGLGVLSIAGFPLFSGFWSKDELLAAVFESGEHHPVFYLLWVLGLVTAMMTAFYMARLWFMTFSGEWRGAPDRKQKLHESPTVMTMPLMVLGFLALFSGIIALFVMPSIGEAGFAGYLRYPQNGHLGHFLSNGDILSHTFGSALTYLSILAGLGGLVLGYLFYYRGLDRVVQPRMDPGIFTATDGRLRVHTFLSDRLGLSDLYNRLGMFCFTHVAAACDWFDRRIIDGLVNGIARGSMDGSRRLRRLQSGLFSTYASMIVGGLLLLLLALKVALPVLGWTP